MEELISFKKFKPEPELKTRRTYSAPVDLLQNYDSTTPKNGAELQRYTKIALNPVVKTALDSLISGAFWANWKILAKNDYKEYPAFEELDKEIIESIEYQIRDLSNESFNNILKNLLYNALVYGVSYAELCWEFVDSKYCVKKILTRPSWLFDVYIDQQDKIEKLHYYPNSAYIDPRKMVVAPWPYLAEGNYYGRSELQAIYHDVKILEILEEKRANGLALTLVKPILHHYDSISKTDEDVLRTVNVLKNAESASVISLPAQANIGTDGKATFTKLDEISILEDRASSDATSDVRETILQIEKRINRALGTPDDLGMATTGVGSLAKSKTEFDLFVSRIRRCQEWLENLVNRQIIPAMVDYNYYELDPEYCMPKFCFDELDEKVVAETLTFYETAIRNKIIYADEPWVRESLGFPPLADDYVPPMEAPMVDENGEPIESEGKGNFPMKEGEDPELEEDDEEIEEDEA